MSVTINYRMNHGNNIFQYICARLFADRHGLRLESNFARPSLLGMRPQENGRRFDREPFVFTDEHDVLDRTWPPGRYIFDGYFQRSHWYHSARKEIEAFAVPGLVPKRPPRDIVINLRLGHDYKELNWRVHPKWYLQILKTEGFDRLHIVTDYRDPDYLSHFASFDPIIVSSGPRGDWKYLRSFDRIVCANSSFSWWAAYFSDASKIYTFKRWIPHEVAKIGAFPNGIALDGPYLHELGAG